MDDRSPVDWIARGRRSFTAHRPMRGLPLNAAPH